MKNKTLRNDLIILGILVVLIGGLFLFKSKQQGAKIVIKRNDQIEGYYSLDDDQIINIDNENKIQIFYKNKVKGSVNVKYIEKNSGEEIKQSKLYEELELGIYDFAAEELENFKLVSDKDISVNLNKENPNQEIEFIYEVNKDKIDIKKRGK